MTFAPRVKGQGSTTDESMAPDDGQDAQTSLKDTLLDTQDPTPSHSGDVVQEPSATLPVLSVLLQQSGCRMLLGAFAARNRATLRRTLSVHSSCSEKPAELSAPTPAGSFSTAGANCCGRCRGGPDCAGQASADGGCPSGGSGTGRCGAAGPDFSSRDSANILHGAFSCGASAIGHLQCCSSMSGTVNSNRGRPVWHVWVSLVGSSCFKHMHVGHHDAVNASHAAQCTLHECVVKTQIAICRCPCTCSGPCGGTCSGCQFAASGCLTRRGAEGTHCPLSGTDCQGVGSEARADHLGPAACRCQAAREEKRCCRPRRAQREGAATFSWFSWQAQTHVQVGSWFGESGPRTPCSQSWLRGRCNCRQGCRACRQ